MSGLWKRRKPEALNGLKNIPGEGRHFVTGSLLNSSATGNRDRLREKM
jgi:hypothetical protein